MSAATLDQLILTAQQQPQEAEPLCELASALAVGGENREALRLLENVVRRFPAHARAWLLLAEVLGNLGEADAAAQCLQQVLKFSPDHPVALVNLAVWLKQEEQYAQASALLQRVLRNDPQQATARFNLANLLAEQGDFEAAREHYSRAMENHPQPAKVLYNFSTITRFSNADRGHLQEWTRLAEQNLRSPDDQVFLHFAVGKAHDDLREFSAAFAHYRQANSLVPTEFDPQAHRDMVSGIMRDWPAEQFTSREAGGSLTGQPVFIVGMPRSGTTLVEQLLAQHTELLPKGEQTALPAVIQQHLQRFPNSPQKKLNPEEASRMAREYLQLVVPNTLDAKFSDKLPANFLRLGWIAALFPKAVILHVQRDPRDVCLSCYFQHFTQRLPYAYSLDHLVSYYREYERLMAHWRNSLPLTIHEVQYEQLVQDPVAASQSLAEWCGLEWHAAHSQESTGTIATASHWQARQPVHTRSRRRWENYREQIPELLAAFGEN